MQDREKLKTANIRSAVKEQEKMINRFLEALKYLPEGWMDLTPVELPSKRSRQFETRKELEKRLKEEALELAEKKRIGKLEKAWRKCENK